MTAKAISRALLTNGGISLTGNPAMPDEATRAYYAAQYALPGAMRAGFAQFTAFSQDVEDNKVFQRTKLTMSVLAVGGEKSFGATEAVVMRNAATNVREAVVPGAGHWLMEESPAFTIALIQDFLKDRLPPAHQPVHSAGETRVTPGEFKFPDSAPGTGTSWDQIAFHRCVFPSCRNPSCPKRCSIQLTDS
jgi:hypothetical protein